MNKGPNPERYMYLLNKMSDIAQDENHDNLIPALVGLLSKVVRSILSWPRVKSVMRSRAVRAAPLAPVAKTKISLPALPVRVSAPAPPVRILALLLPTITLARALPVPSIAEPPVSVMFSTLSVSV